MDTKQNHPASAPPPVHHEVIPAVPAQVQPVPQVQQVPLTTPGPLRQGGTNPVPMPMPAVPATVTVPDKRDVAPHFQPGQHPQHPAQTTKTAEGQPKASPIAPERFDR